MTWRIRNLGWLVILGAWACGDDSTATSGTEGTASDGSSTGAGPSTSPTEGDDTATLTDGGSAGSETTVSADTTAGPSTDDGSSSEGGDTSTGSSGGDTSSGGSESGSSSDDGMMASGCYEAAVHPFAGALCDPGASACTVTVDEPVDPVVAFRNGTPAITHDDGCAPQILYSRASGGFSGFLAVRQGADDWDTVATPEPVALGGIEFDATELHTQVLMYDGAFGVHYSTWDGAFTDEPDPAGQLLLRASGTASLGDGTLELAMTNSNGDLVWGEFDGAWSLGTGDGGETPAIAVTDTGAPQITTWTASVAGWALDWVDPVADVSEEIEPLGSAGLDLADQRIAIVGSTPHVAYARQSLGLHQIRHAERTGAGTWAIATVAAEDPLVNETCDIPAAIDGQTCDYDYVRLRPLGLVASQSGDVLVLYAEDHFMGTVVTVCMPGPPFPTCMWVPQSDQSEYATWIAAPDGNGGWDAQTLVTDRRIVGIDTSLDGEGAVHVAAYVDASKGFVVDYLRIEG
jgi:hypothetical protein